MAGAGCTFSPCCSGGGCGGGVTGGGFSGGTVVGGIAGGCVSGLVGFVGGVVWYFLGAKEKPATAAHVTPWFGPGSGGLSLSHSF